MELPEGIAGALPDENSRKILAAGIGVAALLIAIAAYFLFFSAPPTTDLTVKVTNAEGQALWRANVTIKVPEWEKGKGAGQGLSAITDRNGIAVFRGIRVGGEITIKASGKGFRTAEKKLAFTQATGIVEVALEAETETASVVKTLRFIGPNGESLSGKKLFVGLSCTSGIEIQDPEREVNDGVLKVEVPSGCGAVVARVSASGFESNNYTMEGSGTIRLQALEIENGSVKVAVEDAQGNFLEGIEVVVKDSHSVPTGDKSLTSFGEAVFDLAPGNYTAFVYDPGLKFAEAEKEFEITAKNSSAVKFTLDARPLGTIKVRVLDSGNGADINRARVVVENPSGKKSSRDYTGKEMQLAITEQGVTKISAAADGYSPGAQVEVNSGQLKATVYELRLSKCTQNTCGLLKVRVLDEDGLAVQNARIALTDAKTGFYHEEYGLRHTNYDGIASFAGVKSGKYKALAQKFPAEGASQEFEFRQGEAGEVNVQLTIGSGTVEVGAVDEEGRPIPFGFALFSTDYNRLGRLPLNAEGKAALTMKADKKVFVTVEAQGYAAYTSPSFQVYPEKTITITARLPRPSLETGPRIEFLGLFEETGRQVEKMHAGETYNARFSITMPTGGQFEQAGAFIRAGSEKLVEKDGIYIDAINAPGAAVVKGSTYTEPNGIAEDTANITNSEAKWASIIWDGRKTSSWRTEFSVRLKVRQAAAPGKALPVFYRAYGVTGDGKFIRDQFDSELGEAESATAKGSLYAKSYRKDFFEGASEECKDGFCYGERMLDISNDLILTPPYSLRVFSDYEYSFYLTNNSEAVHDNARLTAKNSMDGTFTEEKLRIRNYSITNAESQVVSSASPAFEVPPVALGKFTRNKAVTGKLTLRPEALGDTALQLQVVSDRQKVFSRAVKAGIVKEKDINVSVSPTTMPAFSEFDLTVTAAFWSVANGSGDFMEVEGALVRVERTTPDRARAVFTATTDGSGKAVIRIPASAPGTKLNIRVEKAGYIGSTVKAEVNKDVVSFRPGRLASSLDLTGKTEEKLQLEATNIVPLNLKISSIRMGGNFGGLLDEARITNWLMQYDVKTQLPYGAPVQLSILTAISEEARRLEEQRVIDATLYFEVSNDSGSIKWPLEVPTRISIGLAEPPKENNCVEVGIKEWKDATLGGKAEVEFSIRNSCLTQEGKPLALRNLKAALKWKGNKHGNVEIHVQNPDSGQEASDVLSEGMYATLFESVPPEKEFIALLTFTPKGGTIGKKAEFSVLIDAGQVTNAGEQLVGASNQVESEIDIIDLGECIKFSPDAEVGIVMQEGEEESVLEIDSSACGNVDIDFWLCKDNKGCSGGAEGGILVKPEQFRLTQTSPKKKVQVARQEVPGLYGINAAIRTPRSNYREVAVVDALIKPTQNDAFKLRKYEFTLKGAGAKDSTELTNRLFVQNINVDASICDWGEASEKEWWNWTGAGVGAVLGALKGMQVAMTATHASSKGLATSLWGKLFGAKAKQKTAAASTKASNSSLEAVCSEVQSAQSSVAAAQGPCAKTLAEPGVAGAVAPFETAMSQCESAKGQAQGLAPIDDATMSGLDDGIPAIGGGAGGLGAAAASMASKQGAEAAVKASLTAAAAELQAAAASLEAAEAALAPQCEADAEGCAMCQSYLSSAAASTQGAAAKMESFITQNLAKSGADTSASAAAVGGTQAAAAGAQTAMAPAVSAATSATGAFSTTTIMSAYTLGGFFIGGVLPGLFGQDPCDQRHASDLPDYIINLLSDAKEIGSSVERLSAEYDSASARIIGNYKEQRIGVVFSNSGVSSPKPVYSTFTFNATQHTHANPTHISRGNSNFGPFNVPDNKKVEVAAKLHLKFRTQEQEETLPELEFDSLSCVSGNKVGRTGEKALPRVKLSWNFGENGIPKDGCAEQNPEGMYCDAAQFSIMLSKRLKSLKEFFDRNPTFTCPPNPLYSDLAKITKDLNVQQGSGTGSGATNGTGAEASTGTGAWAGASGSGTRQSSGQGCFIASWTGYLEGEPALKYLIEANENNIQWTTDIPSKEALTDTIHFNALLIQDGYTQDFMKDFSSLYSSGTFFDTPQWFNSLATDAVGKKYGIGRLFEGGRVKLTNRFYDSPRLSSAGTYEVLVNLEGDDGTYKFFRADGTPNIKVTLETYLLQEPNPSSAFYSLPFDGLVGLEGDTFDRQGYGTAFSNRDTSELVSINKEPAPVKTYNDSGSNPIVLVDAGVEKRPFELNTSPSGRGSLLTAEKTSEGKGRLLLWPSHATPVMLKAQAGTISEENLAAYYTLTSSDTPIDVGSTLTYWDGVGACLDPSGLLITEAFNDRADRASASKDPVLNWQSAYAVDFGKVNYTGDAYIRTILYTNPLEDTSLTLEQPNAKVQLLTPDEAGQKVRLRGVAGVPFNSPSGGSQGSVQAVSDVFGLVKDGRVCVVDSGRKASFFWNPKAVYEMQGTQRNISELTNSLSAGKTCIGFG